MTPGLRVVMVVGHLRWLIQTVAPFAAVSVGIAAYCDGERGFAFAYLALVIGVAEFCRGTA
jgi:hypothetical protein